MKPLRVLIATQGYAPGRGGTEKAMERLAEELVRQYGDEVCVLTTNCYSGEAFNRPALPRMAAGAEVRNGVRVRRFPVWARVSQLAERPQSFFYRHRLPGSQYLRAWYQGPVAPGLARALRREACDVVVASSFPLLHMFQSLWASRSRGLPSVLIGGLHPHDDWGFQRPMIYRAIRRATRYIAWTSFERDYVCERGAQRTRTAVVPLGVDAGTFAAASQSAARSALGVPPEAPLVGFIGQLGSHKGLDTLLRAMPEVWRSLPETWLLIAGARTVFSEEIHRTVAAWPPSRRRQVLLRYDFDEAEKAPLFSALDVLAYPSGYESFGIAFLEAWAAGKPVIGCPDGAVSSVVDRGRDGLLVPYQDEDLLAGALLAVLKNPGWARQLGETGRHRVLGEMTWARVARRFRAVLEQAVRNP